MQTTMQFDLLNLTCGSNPKERSKKCTKCTLPEFLVFCLIPPEVEGSFSPTSGRRLEKPGAIARSCATGSRALAEHSGFTWLHNSQTSTALGRAGKALSQPRVCGVSIWSKHQRVLRTLGRSNLSLPKPRTDAARSGPSVTFANSPQINYGVHSHKIFHLPDLPVL